MTSQIQEDQVDLQGNGTSSRSHESPQPLIRPFASRGSGRVSNSQKAPADNSNPAAADNRSRVPCKFWISNKGCRAGESCPFLHASQPQAASVPPTAKTPSGRGDGVSLGDPHSEAQNTQTKPTQRDAQPSRAVVSKPVPTAQQINPREFQLKQVERRYSSTISLSEAEHGTILEFKLVPSDPDFPFELNGLSCTLIVPKDYPKKGVRPSLRVTNPEIERGFAINVERGFDALASQHPNRTLLSLLNELDKNLEAFLTAPKAQTVKFVTNSAKQERKPVIPASQVHEDDPVSLLSTVQPVQQFSEQEKAQARTKRESDIRQLEARLRNIPLFDKSSDGRSFNVPLTIPKPARLAPSLQLLKEITLLVPLLYNLEPCTIKLKGLSGDDVENVEMAFERHSREEPALTLMAHVNYLSQNMHLMAKERAAPVNAYVPVTTTPALEAEATNPPQISEFADLRVNADRPHVQMIPRPIEWDQDPDGSDEESSEYSSDEYSDSENHDEGEEGGAALPSDISTKAPTGNSILLSFPDIEMYGIELLSITSLSLTLKCDRCKSNVDAHNIKAKSGDVTTTVSESCAKCASTLSASYISDPVHANSIKAGHLDLHGCTVADMLPSVFTPTCSNCSTTYPAPPGIISVRGETALAVCRSCHQKMTFKIPEAKFLRVSSALASSLPLRQKKKKENLGIVSGTPLPNFGKCSHYRKSHRWFRFSCCGKVFPCDRCHDEQADPKHPNEHANRMICGYCSREQNYRPEDCGVCHASLVGRRGTGFWEGGQGTRDKARMSRKDPRKYKRQGGGSVKKT